MVRNGLTLKRHKKCIAYHEAGYAAGIHLNNATQPFPSVDFKIILDVPVDAQATEAAYQNNQNDGYLARVEGGRLVNEMPPIISWDCELIEHEEANRLWLKYHQHAFDVDMVNMMVGALAEAKYVAENDNEPFNARLVNLNALANYGGGDDLDLIHDYLQRFPFNQQQRLEKLAELFASAFHFVSNEARWAAISRLADFIMDSREHVIAGESVVSILEQSLECFQNRQKLLSNF